MELQIFNLGANAFLVLVLPNSLLLLFVFDVVFIFFLYFSVSLPVCLSCWCLQVFDVKLSQAGFVVWSVIIIIIIMIIVMRL